MAEFPEVEWDDEEEEPLFADEVEGEDEEDPPPLPPPMPPLSHLSQTTAGVDGGGGGGGGGTTGPSTGEQREEIAALQKKRAPILTLTIDRIFSDKGLPYVEREFPKLKFKGKGHETADLKYLLRQYEHWANFMYPKMTFKDVTERIERLATKKEFKTQLAQMRRRWVRGPTPTPDNGEDDDTTTRHHHDDSPTHQTNGQRGVESSPGVPGTGEHSTEPEDAEEEDEEREEREGSSTDDIVVYTVNPETQAAEGGSTLDMDVEADITREREHPSRKRERPVEEEEQEHQTSTSSVEETRVSAENELSSKTPRLSWSEEDTAVGDMDESLSEEDVVKSEVAMAGRDRGAVTGTGAMAAVDKGDEEEWKED